ncbi:hypothetical protein ACFFK0_00600 [Paenibacillus chartarius]|uniref:Spore coat protein n=1 Tax=Paenibacillus chartarius TaxID=747481 RepID=A0ABV6DE90_9BACL
MKMLLWLARKLVGAAVISVLSLFSAWFVVNLYVEEMMKTYQIPQLGKKVQFTDVLARLGEQSNIVGLGTTASSGPREAAQEDLPAAARPESEGGKDVSSGGGSTSGKPSETEEYVPEDAVAVSGRLSQSGDAAGSGSANSSGVLSSLVMSTEEFAKKKAAMSSEDKMKLFSLLVGKLPPDQLQSISTMIEDGITSEELKQLDETMQKHLTQEEYKQILDMVTKY